jgi:hypothetical protein
MNTSSTRVGRWLTTGLACLVVVFSFQAHADDTAALNKVVELNRKALKTYDDLDMETSLRLLKEAIELCNLEGLQRHRAAARTHIHLGVVYVAGLKQRNEGLVEFRRAVGIDPAIRVTRSVSNPEVEAVFAEALAAGGEPLSTESAPVAPRTHPTRAVAATPAGAAKESAINHPPVTEAVVGKAIEIKAQVPRSAHSQRVVLAYRAGPDGEFLAREMRPIVSAPGWYHEKIPADAIQSAEVSYYIEAQDDDGQPLIASGTQAAPHVINIVSETTDAADALSAGNDVDRGGHAHPLWFVLAVGGGAGYYSGSPEMNSVDDHGGALESSGTQMATLGHLAPELGYFHSEHLLLSLQARIQFVTGSEDVTYAGRTYKTSKTALAGLAKLSYFLTEASAHFQPFVALEAGMGEIRYAVKTTPLLGCGQNGGTGACKDTVRGGLGLFGAAVGFVYMLGDHLGLYASLNGLVGAPNFAVDGDLNLGVAVVR